MLSVLSLVLYVTVIPVGLVLGSTPERLALLVLAALLLLKAASRRSMGRAHARRHALAAVVPHDVLALPSSRKMTRSDYAI